MKQILYFSIACILILSCKSNKIKHNNYDDLTDIGHRGYIPLPPGTDTSDCCLLPKPADSIFYNGVWYFKKPHFSGTLYGDSAKVLHGEIIALGPNRIYDYRATDTEPEPQNPILYIFPDEYSNRYPNFICYKDRMFHIMPHIGDTIFRDSVSSYNNPRTIFIHLNTQDTTTEFHVGNIKYIIYGDDTTKWPKIDSSRGGDKSPITNGKPKLLARFDILEAHAEERAYGGDIELICIDSTRSIDSTKIKK